MNSTFIFFLYTHFYYISYIYFTVVDMILNGCDFVISPFILDLSPFNTFLSSLLYQFYLLLSHLEFIFLVYSLISSNLVSFRFLPNHFGSVIFNPSID